jgi:hypothetical protein
MQISWRLKVARLCMQDSVEEIEENYEETDQYINLLDKMEWMIEEDAAASDEDDE